MAPGKTSVRKSTAETPEVWPHHRLAHDNMFYIWFTQFVILWVKSVVVDSWRRQLRHRMATKSNLASLFCPRSAISKWTGLFQNELKTEQESLVFVKRMMALAVSSITYLRGIFPEDAYRSRYLEGEHKRPGILWESGKFVDGPLHRNCLTIYCIWTCFIHSVQKCFI